MMFYVTNIFTGYTILYDGLSQSIFTTIKNTV
jgi:hypothetical protein